jgi:hypothetical protein
MDWAPTRIRGLMPATLPKRKLGGKHFAATRITVGHTQSPFPLAGKGLGMGAPTPALVISLNA